MFPGFVILCTLLACDLLHLLLRGRGSAFTCAATSVRRFPGAWISPDAFVYDMKSAIAVAERLRLSGRLSNVCGQIRCLKCCVTLSGCCCCDANCLNTKSDCSDRLYPQPTPDLPGSRRGRQITCVVLAPGLSAFFVVPELNDTLQYVESAPN